MTEVHTSCSLVICTHNRPEVLENCLQSVTNQSILPDEIIVVDNSPEDRETELLVKSYIANNGRIKYECEPATGLSFARNHGWKQAQGPWIAYIDDDAILPKKYFQVLRSIIRKHPDIICFGGPYFAYYEKEKPKWISQEFGNKHWGEIKDQQLVEANLSGSNFVIRKEILRTIGGFPSHLGMSGTRISYGEEDFVQEKIKHLGHKIHFFPELFLNHSVLPHKLVLSWHLKHAIASGESQPGPQSTFNSLGNLFKQFCISLFLRLPIGFIKVIFNRDYYYQNLILDLATPVLFHFGACRRKAKS